MKIFEQYIDLGWVVVPIAAKEKNPNRRGWEELRLQKGQAATIEFMKRPNIGVHLGPSGLIDIDLDCAEAVELAAQHLPETATFGRAGNPRSHWIYEGSATYRKFIDPIDKKCLLELRSGDGLQSVFPGSVHESGEDVEWTEDEPEISEAPEDFAQRVGVFAQLVWCAKHPGKALHPKVLGWDGSEPSKESEQHEDQEEPDVFFDGNDEKLIDLIVEHCPEGSRHDYRLSVAGAMYRAGISQKAAVKMLREAMADERLGDDRSKAIKDSLASVKDTYTTQRNTTGANTLINEFEAKEVVERIEELCTPTLESKKDPWLQRLFETALGGNLEVLEDAEIKNGLAKMLLAKDSNLPVIWAKLKDAGYQHTKELRESAEFRVKEIRDKINVGKPSPAKHPEASGMDLPPGYRVEEGRLKTGDELVMNGQLELLGKCPGLEGTQVRFAFRSPSSKQWKTSIAPYRSLVSTKDVLVLAEHGCNVSSLEAPALVAYVRDYVSANEKKLDRPIATRTGWHESGAFVWGRNVLKGSKDLKAEYPADNQIALGYVDALHAKGSEETSAAARPPPRVPRDKSAAEPAGNSRGRRWH